MNLYKALVARARSVWAEHRPIVVAALVCAVAGFAGGVVIGLSSAVTAGLILVVVLIAVGLVSRAAKDHSADDEVALGLVVSRFAMAIVVTLVVIQAVPYGRDHANPDVVNEPAWSSPRTRELVVGACYDCHSNEVVWPWYSNIAPVSWAVSAHVAGGRDAVNFSDFVPGQADGHKSIETIKEGSMPPGYFTAFGLHSDANLSDEEVAELIDGLETTPGLAEEEEGDD